jgi:hypothetical protein
MLITSQIRKRDFAEEPYNGESRESYAFYKFIINSLQSKGLSSTLHVNPSVVLTVPMCILINKEEYESLDRQHGEAYLKKKERYREKKREYDIKVQEILDDDSLDDSTKESTIKRLGAPPATPKWSPPPPGAYSKEQQDTYNRITANAAKADDQASISLSHIIAHCSPEVILKCNNLLEADQVPTREKLLSLVEWIKRRRSSDKKVISKVQDDMKRLPTATDWHGAVANTLNMDILQEELRTMSAPYSDRDLIILHLQYLSDDPCFQQLQMKYSQTDLDDEDLSSPQLREQQSDGSMQFPPLSSTSSAQHSHTWKAYCTEVKRYQMSLKESQPKTVLSARSDTTVPPTVNAALTESTVKTMITEAMEALRSDKQKKDHPNRHTRIRDKNQDYLRYPQPRPPRGYDIYHDPRQWTNNPYYPPRGPPLPYLPRGPPPMPRPLSPRGPTFTFHPRGPPQHHFDHQPSHPRGLPYSHPSHYSSPITPQNSNGKRAYGAAFEPQEYHPYDPNSYHFPMEQEFYANAALTQYPSPMDHTYYDEAAHPNTENPGDYSSADGSDN